ncbi:hypothetical protein BJV78DRAFT_1166958 [Lactifluus subvellereus]|nr:hypothetical protein BJV78DRAFT_1166958 [Lactifluus subvellereus]
MPLNCQPSPSQRGLEPRPCPHAHAMEKPLSTKSSQGNNAASVHTIDVVLPEKSRPAYFATSFKGDEALPQDRSQNRSSIKKTDTHPNAEISAVPDPVPNPLFPVASSSAAADHTSPLFESPRTATGNASSGLFVYPSSLGVHNPLLSLSSTASALSSVPLTFAMSTSVSAERPLPTFIKAPLGQTTSHQIPATAIILLTMGGVFFVVAILVGTKLCTQTRRRSHPTPSLPILQDAFPTRKIGDESPLFGGNERLSSQPGNNAIPWTWTQYQSGIPKPLPMASASKPGVTNQLPKRYSRIAPNVPHAGEEPTRQEVAANPGATNQALDGHPSKALSRLSSLSGLVHPASMHESSGQENIGIAVSSGQLEGDLEYGISANREHGKRASARQSLRDLDKRRSTIYGSPEGLAYTMSPSTAPNGDQSDGSSRRGRARVKAPYGAGSYMRGLVSTRADRPEGDPFGDQGCGTGDLSSGRPPVANVLITPDRLDALGSPGLSLYPDDSMSVAEERNWIIPKTVKGKVYAEDSPEGSRDGEDRLAMNDRRLSGAVPGVVAGRLNVPSAWVGEARIDDRPPRVPSPPVLPSLAQMAMGHTNGQEYGDYRSPTYSLYGLYSERKSRLEGYKLQ